MTQAEPARGTTGVDAEGRHVFPPSWQGLKQQVIYLAQFGGGIQVVEGVSGAGKTTFAEWLHDDPEAPDVAVVTLSAEIDGHGLVYQLLLQLGLRPQAASSLGELLVALRSYVQSLHRDGVRGIVVIDDAHLLADADLGALLSVMEGGEETGFGLHLIMMAEPGLTSRIDRLQVLDVVVHDAAIPALSPAEVGVLLARLAPPVAADNAVRAQQLWRQSAGIPGRLLTLLGQPAGSPAPEEVPPHSSASRTPFRGWPVAHLVALVFLCCILLWAFVAQRDEPEPTRTVVDATALVNDSAGGQGAGLPAPGSTAELARPDADQVSSLEPESEPETAAARAEALTALNSVAAERRRQAREMAQAPMQGSAGQNTRPMEPRSSAVEERAPQAPAEIESAPAPVAPAASGGEGAIGDEFVIASEAKLLRYTGNAYVLQLMASAAPQTLLSFVAEQPNREHLLVYRARRNDKLLHILVEGFYADKAAASAAVMNLPQEQKKAGPWPKRIEQIHRDIEEIKGN